LRYTHPTFVSFASFAVVGLSGLGVYIAASIATTSLISPSWLAITIAIWIAMTWNFAWDRKLAFWDAQKKSIYLQYFGFILICSVGAVPNAFITLWANKTEVVPLSALLGGLAGASIGIVFNFLMNRFYVFRKKK
jgi:dolichol-phosphate mannosyltransferase